MCKYCNKENPKSVKGGDYEGNEYRIKGNTLEVDVTVAIYGKYGNKIVDYENIQDFITINYCPFCGKKIA